MHPSADLVGPFMHVELGAQTCTVRVCRPPRPLPQSLPDYQHDYGAHSALFPEDAHTAEDEVRALTARQPGSEWHDSGLG